MAVKRQAFEELLSQPEALLSDQRHQLAELDDQIRAAPRAKGISWSPLERAAGGSPLSIALQNRHFTTATVKSALGADG